MLMDWPDTPGFAIGIVKDTSIILIKGYGYRDIENKLLVDEHTKFGLGSTTKTFTSASFGVLMDIGLIDLSKPIINVIPDFRMFDEYSTKHMTFEDLLSHKTGLPAHYILSQGKDMNSKQLFDALPYLKPNALLREKFQYNNLMYELSGYLVERISNELWEDFTRKNILEPLEMVSTGFFHNRVYDEPNFAKSYFYDYKENEFEDSDYLSYFPVKNPSGGMYSSVNDMCNWIIMNLQEGKYKGKQIVSKEYLENAQKIHIGNNADRGWNFKNLAYGLGWQIQSYQGNLIIGHAGGGHGFDSELIVVPEKKIGISVLCNTRNGTAYMVMRMLMDRILDLDFFDWSDLGYNRWRARYVRDAENDFVKEIVKDSELLKDAGDYVGIYEHPGYGEIKIDIRNGMLVGTRKGIEFVLHQKYPTIFDLECKENFWYDTRTVQFQFDMNGEIAKLNANFEPSVEPIEFIKAQ